MAEAVQRRVDARYVQLSILLFRAAIVMNHVIGVVLGTLLLITLVLRVRPLPSRGALQPEFNALVFLLAVAVLGVLWIYLGNRVNRVVRDRRIMKLKQPELISPVRISSGWLAEALLTRAQDRGFARRLAAGSSLSVSLEGLRIWTNPSERPAVVYFASWADVRSIEVGGTSVRPFLIVSVAGVEKAMKIACLGSRPFSAERVRGRSLREFESSVRSLWKP